MVNNPFTGLISWGGWHCGGTLRFPYFPLYIICVVQPPPCCFFAPDVRISLLVCSCIPDLLVCSRQVFFGGKTAKQFTSWQVFGIPLIIPLAHLSLVGLYSKCNSLNMLTFSREPKFCLDMYVLFSTNVCQPASL